MLTCVAYADNEPGSARIQARRLAEHIPCVVKSATGRFTGPAGPVEVYVEERFAAQAKNLLECRKSVTRNSPD
jgi:hypothetical protein